MKKNVLGLVVALSALCTVSSFAADNKKDMTTIMNLVSGMVSNGDVGKVVKYDANKYDEYDEQRAAIVDFLDQGGCADGGIKPRANIENNIKLMTRVSTDGSGEPGEVEQMMKIVRKMNKAKQFKAILSVSWDEKEEASEGADGVSCSIYLIRLFTVDGYRLSIVYSHTD